jgi:hypothetical protein
MEFLVTGPVVTAVAFGMIASETGRGAAAASILVYVLALPLVVGLSLPLQRRVERGHASAGASGPCSRRACHARAQT